MTAQCISDIAVSGFVGFCVGMVVMELHINRNK